MVMIIQLLVTWLDLWWLVTWLDRSRNDFRLDLDLSYSQLTWDLIWLALWPKDLWLDLDLQQMTCDLTWTCNKWLAYISAKACTLITHTHAHAHTHTHISTHTYILICIHTSRPAIHVMFCKIKAKMCVKVYALIYKQTHIQTHKHRDT